MATYAEYVAVYRTELLERPFGKIIVDPVKIEIASGPQVLVVPVFLGGSAPAGKERQLIDQRELLLPAGSTYVVLTARVTAANPGDAEGQGSDEVDRVIATLSLLYTPELFSEPLYRGFKATHHGIHLTGWLRLTPPFAIDRGIAGDAITAVKRHVVRDEEKHRRFGLMARFLVKAAAYAPGEEKFVMLWTILEIFPMKDTTDIAPISGALGRITGHSEAETKEKLGIGRLFGARSDLVHNGTLPIPFPRLGETIGRLEAMCVCIMRDIAGFQYDGALEPYFAKARS